MFYKGKIPEERKKNEKKQKKYHTCKKIMYINSITQNETTNTRQRNNEHGQEAKEKRVKMINDVKTNVQARRAQAHRAHRAHRAQSIVWCIIIILLTAYAVRADEQTATGRTLHVLTIKTVRLGTPHETSRTRTVYTSIQATK
jgi:hypothetical protein